MKTTITLTLLSRDDTNLVKVEARRGDAHTVTFFRQATLLAILAHGGDIATAAKPGATKTITFTEQVK